MLERPVSFGALLIRLRKPTPVKTNVVNSHEKTSVSIVFVDEKNYRGQPSCWLTSLLGKKYVLKI